MTPNRPLLAGVVAIGVLWMTWLVVLATRSGEAIDLVSEFEQAQKRPHAGLFSVADATLNGETRTAIAVEPAAATEVRYKVRIPKHGRLSVSVGLKPEAWTERGDGVLFRVTISAGGKREELFTQHVTPFENPDDRTWIPVIVDLSSYAGQEADVVFATSCGRIDGGDDRRGDFAVWGHPRIVGR